MTDEDFIVYLCEQMWGNAIDGSEIDLEKIKEELIKRKLKPEDIFVY